MKKVYKWSLISFGSIIGLLVLTFILMMLKFKSETKEMNPILSKYITDSIYTALDQFSNVYFIKGQNHIIAIDAGKDEETLLAEMKKINVSPDKVNAVFLTHTDSDHIGAVKLFKNAVIYLSKEEEQMINGKIKRLLIFKNKLESPYKTFSDGERFNFNDLEVQAILTPGHTPGSTSYLVNSKYLFTGDTLSIKQGSVEQFNEFFNMDTKTQLQSFKKIINLKGIVYLFTSHYGSTNNYEKVFKKWK